MCHCSRKQRSAGFTLVEMLMVFVIIAILIGILVPVISSAFKTGKEAAEKTEIDSLVTALQRFKTRYGVYPPSAIVLKENGAYDVSLAPYVGPTGLTTPIKDQNTAVFDESLSAQYLRRIWPQMVINTNGNAVNYTNNGAASDINRSNNTANDSNDFYDWNGDGVANGPWYLQGDECLIFFLGGMVVGELSPGSGPTGRQSGPISYIGFSKRPHNPAENPVWLATFTTNVVSASATASREEVYFDFQKASSRLMDRDDDSFYEMIPSRNLGQAPYVYFTSYEGVGYRPDDLNLAAEPNGNSTNKRAFAISWRITNSYPSANLGGNGTSTDPYHVLSEGPNPYTQGESYPSSPTQAFPGGWVPRYMKADAFQIISAGPSLGYGDGGEFPLPTTGNIEDKDNLSNFAKSELKDGEGN